MKQMVISRDRNAIARFTDNQVMILNPVDGKLFTLNSTATIIWKCLWKPRPREYLIKKIMKAFEINENKAISDIDTFLKKSLQNNLLIKNTSS